MTTTSKKIVPSIRFPEFENSGEWEERKLGDIGEIITGKTPSTSNRELWKDEIAFVTPSDIKGNKYQYITERMVTNINIKLLPLGTIMFSCIATIGKIAIAKVVCTTNQQINSIIVDIEKINNEFVYYSLQSIISKIKAKYEKDAFSIINKTEFSNILIQVSPLNTEQQKIADFLSSVDELIELEQKKLETLKEYKKGLLENLFPKENQKVPDLRFPEFENSGEWEERKLGDIGEIITGKTPSTSNRELWKDEIAFVTPSDIKGNKYQYITERMVTNINIKLLPLGTIMFSCIATIGKIAIAKVVCTTNQQINSIIVDIEKINNEFVYYSLQSIISKIKAKYEKDAFSIINKTEFSNILIQVSPLNTEQQKIADFLSSVDELIIEQTTKLQLLYDYKKGLLQQLFPN